MLKVEHVYICKIVNILYTNKATNKFIDMDEEGIAEYKFITYFC